MDFDLFGPSSGSPCRRRQHRCQGWKCTRSASGSADAHFGCAPTLEVPSSWLAVSLDRRRVCGMRQCLFVPNEIQQVSLPSDTAGEECTAVLPAATGFGQVGQRIGDPQECFYSPGQRCSWLRRRARTVPSVLCEQPHGGGVHQR